MTKEEFYQEYCARCGSQRCSGPNGGMAKGCPHYILEFERKKDIMNAKLIVEGKEFDIQIMDVELQKLLTKKSDTGYERADHLHEYCYISADGLTEKTFDSRDFMDEARYGTANYYSDKSVAADNARADTLMRLLRRFAVERRENKIDWCDECQYKYYIYFDYIHMDLTVDYKVCVQNLFNIYFDSKPAALKAIEIFHDELIWYFTEYKDSL